MANRIKSISKYSGSAWGTEIPIGADAANVDLATSYTTVTESTATSGATAEAAIGKIHTDTINLKKAGHGNGTVTNYDSTSSETSKVLTTDCVVAASDDTATAWSKFNRFRRRVSNKFTDYFQIANLVTSSTGVTTTGTDTTVYTSKAINNYFANVIGYTSAADVINVGSVADQLSTLNNRSIVQATGATPDTVLNLASGVITEVPLTQTTINQDITNDVVLNTSVHTLGINTPGTYKLTGSIYTNVTGYRCGVYLKGDAFNVTAPNAKEIAAALVVGSLINVSKIITVTQGCYIWLCARVLGATGICYTGHGSTFLQIERLR